MKETGVVFLVGALYVILTNNIEVWQEARVKADQKRLQRYKDYRLVGSRWR